MRKGDQGWKGVRSDISKYVGGGRWIMIVKKNGGGGERTRETFSPYP